MRPALSIATALFVVTLLPGCASWEQPVEATLDPNHKQFITGSRIAHKGRGGPDAVREISRAGVADQMRSRIEAQPQSR